VPQIHSLDFWSVLNPDLGHVRVGAAKRLISLRLPFRIPALHTSRGELERQEPEVQDRLADARTERAIVLPTTTPVPTS
jgi:hypothetical protein